MVTPKMVKPSKAVLRKVQLLKTKKGMIAAIEPASGESFFGKTLIQALERGRKKYPASLFYFVRVGYPAAYSHKGGLRRA